METCTEETSKTAKALDRRNRQAEKVWKLENELHEARVALRLAEDKVNEAQRAENTSILFGRGGWELV